MDNGKTETATFDGDKWVTEYIGLAEKKHERLLALLKPLISEQRDRYVSDADLEFVVHDTALRCTRFLVQESSNSQLNDLYASAMKTRSHIAGLSEFDKLKIEGHLRKLDDGKIGQKSHLLLSLIIDALTAIIKASEERAKETDTPLSRGKSIRDKKLGQVMHEVINLLDKIRKDDASVSLSFSSIGKIYTILSATSENDMKREVLRNSITPFLKANELPWLLLRKGGGE